ncbi:MAG: MBL fold metallo-hydrolase [Gammaproteobacteria bacterium]|jgi:glyoxylase-like metal-dependent hydrolase (beta-lactamase superfamily II)|nr:MBL fold metallo-hydrolase [Candidatus Thioaporhodococcus sediminis]TNF56411.1 MAG: MBL fold metallo-hydrolase [Gammaproteobacteria bacterium]
MSHPITVAENIFAIETGLYRHGLAACYLVREGDRLAFIDTGTAHTTPHLLQFIAELGLTPDHVEWVIPTHVHLDHAGGTGDLMAACPEATLVIHPKGAPHMLDPSRLVAGASAVYGAEGFAKDYKHLLPVPKSRMILAEDGMEIDLAGRKLVFIDTPGHANHHGCIWDERTQGFFTGDTFGIAYKEFNNDRGDMLFAPTTPVAFDPEAWLTSIDRLMGYQPQRMYLTHYGCLENPAALAEDLRQSVRDLEALALAEEARPAEGRLDRLRTAVGDHLVRRVRDHGCDLPESRVRELLALDTDLNAQGLEVWLIRRQKALQSGQPVAA